MKDLILWALVLVAYFTSIFPRLASPETVAERVICGILRAMLGGLIGFGFGQALSAIL